GLPVPVGQRVLRRGVLHPDRGRLHPCAGRRRQGTPAGRATTRRAGPRRRTRRRRPGTGTAGRVRQRTPDDLPGHRGVHGRRPHRPALRTTRHPQRPGMGRVVLRPRQARHPPPRPPPPPRTPKTHTPPAHPPPTTPPGSTKASATSPPKTNPPAEAKPSAPPAKPDSTPLTTPELRSTGNYAKIF